MKKQKFTITKPFDEMCKKIVSILQEYYGTKSSLTIEKKNNKEVWYYPLDKKLPYDEIRGFYIRVVKLNNTTTHIDVVYDGSDKFPLSYIKNMVQGFINELFTIYNEQLTSMSD